VQLLFNQVRNDFCICLGNKLVTLGRQLMLECQVVLHDAVVHDHNAARAVTVRMRIFLGGAAMRSPARVANAIGAFERTLANHLFQPAQLAGGAAQLQSVTKAANGDARRIVAAILQAAQPLNDDRNDVFPLTNVSNNAAHNSGSLSCMGRHARCGWLRCKAYAGPHRARPASTSSLPDENGTLQSPDW